MVAPTLAPAPAASRRTARHAAAGILLALIGVLALDGLCFRTPFYPSILEPDSSTGMFELILRREQAAQQRNGDNLVVTIGDSRFAYSPRLSNEITGRTGLILRHAGVAGTDPRSWFYMLRDLDPTARRYRALVIGVPDFDDEDEVFNPNDDLRALHYAIARLRWTDIPEFTLSYDGWSERWQTFRGSLLKGAVLQQDLRQFLTHPVKRLKYIALCRDGYEGWTYNYLETPRSMAGLTIDWSTYSVAFPPGVDGNQRDTVNEVLLRRPAPQLGHLARFRRHWLGRIVERYRGSPTRVIFVRLPRGAIARPDNLVRRLSSSVREYASQPNVTLAPEHAFDPLERPELFRDAIHLNREGIARFSPMLAEEVARILAR